MYIEGCQAELGWQVPSFQRATRNAIHVRIKLQLFGPSHDAPLRKPPPMRTSTGPVTAATALAQKRAPYLPSSTINTHLNVS